MPHPSFPRPRAVTLLMVVALAVTACSSDDGSGDTPTTTAAQSDTTITTTTTATTTTVADDTTTTTSAPDDTSTTTSTTTTTLPPPDGSLAMTTVVFGDNPYVVVTNLGATAVDLGDYWLCQRPSYSQVPAFTVEPGANIAIAFTDTPPPDIIAIDGSVDLGAGLGGITVDGGELGLYRSSDFGSSAAIVDYVEWGSGGRGRESVAVEAGIWVEAGFVEVPSESLSISTGGLEGNAPTDWFANVGG